MNKTILIVDDSESIRELVCSTLKSGGYHVIKGIDGNDGLEQLGGSEDVQLIITDLNMPGMDGIDLVKSVRSNPAFKYLPILILTTESQLSKRMEAKEAGATGWIIKPFVKDRLLNVVQKVMR